MSGGRDCLKCPLCPDGGLTVRLEAGTAGNISDSHDWPMLQDTRIDLFLKAELFAALQANDLDTLKRWIYGSIQDPGEVVVTELLLDWIDPFNTEVEAR